MTTAAWEVEPPRSVTTARAAIIPLTSSGLVVGRTSTVAPSAAAAASESGTALPLATPGQAATPRARTSPPAATSSESRGASTVASCSTLTRQTASAWSIAPSSARSTAERTAACGERLAERVCSR